MREKYHGNDIDEFQIHTYCHAFLIVSVVWRSNPDDWIAVVTMPTSCVVCCSQHSRIENSIELRWSYGTLRSWRWCSRSSVNMREYSGMVQIWKKKFEVKSRNASTDEIHTTTIRTVLSCLSSKRLRPWYGQKVMPSARIELTTSSLLVTRSTTELGRLIWSCRACCWKIVK